MKSKVRRLVLIDWVDSHSSRSGWLTLDELSGRASPLYCRTVGWLVAEKQGAKVIASSLSGERNGDLELCGNGDITIPDKAILKLTNLRVPVPSR